MNTENGEAEKGRCQNTNHQSNTAIGKGCVASYGHAAGCQHGNEKACYCSAYTGK